jgi:hypothetical protein
MEKYRAIVAKADEADKDNEIFTKSALENCVADINKKKEEGKPVPVFFDFRRKELTLPLGCVDSAELKDGNLWCSICIGEKNILELLKDPEMRKELCLSPGGRIDEIDKEVRNGVTIINKFDLACLSIIRKDQSVIPSQTFLDFEDDTKP